MSRFANVTTRANRGVKPLLHPANTATRANFAGKFVIREFVIPAAPPSAPIMLAGDETFPFTSRHFDSGGSLSFKFESPHPTPTPSLWRHQGNPSSKF